MSVAGVPSAKSSRVFVILSAMITVSSPSAIIFSISDILSMLTTSSSETLFSPGSSSTMSPPLLTSWFIKSTTASVTLVTSRTSSSLSLSAISTRLIVSTFSRVSTASSRPRRPAVIITVSVSFAEFNVIVTVASSAFVKSL